MLEKGEEVRRFWDSLKGTFLGRCPNCGEVGTYKERNDTNMLLYFTETWKECSKCGYIGERHKCGDRYKGLRRE